MCRAPRVSQAAGACHAPGAGFSPVEPVQRADVDVRAGGLLPPGFSALREILIHQGSQVLVAAIPALPKIVQAAKNSSGQLQRGPHPVRLRLRLFDFDPLHLPALLRDHRVEQLGVRDRKQEKRERIVTQNLQAVFGKPDGVRHTQDDGFAGRDPGQRSKNRIAQSGGPGHRPRHSVAWPLPQVELTERPKMTNFMSQTRAAVGGTPSRLTA